MTTLADVIAALEQRYPLETAQSWDQVGLVSGDPEQAVETVMLAVDPTQAVIEEAIATGAQLLITHHPLMLRGVNAVPSTTSKGRAVRALISSGLALYVAHTNADVAAGGVNDALAAAIGLGEVEPMVIEEGQPMGRIGMFPAPVPLRDFAIHLGEVLPAAAGGIRVSGDPDEQVQRIAVSGGAGDSFFGAARSCNADVFVTADLRHHPVLEDRETSSGGRPFIIDAGHWATESLWLNALRESLGAEFDGAAGRDRLDLHICTLRTDPWSFVVGATGPEGLA